MTDGRLHGIVPPLVTPLLDRDTLDIAGLERLLEYVIGAGVHGLFILGTTGEAPSLSYRLRQELINLTCRQVGGRIPVLVGVTDTSFVETIQLAHHAADAGASAVVLSAPYYFPAGQTELTTYIQNVVAQLPLPLILYNMPSLTKISFELETLGKLSKLEGIIGIKDSSGDLAYFESLMSLRSSRPDWSIMLGPEALLARSIQLGGDGGVAGGANVFPRLFVECYRAAVSGDSKRVTELSRIIDSFQKIYDVGKYASRHIKATKCSLSLLGICNDFMAEPFHRFHQPERERIWSILEPIRTQLEETIQ